MPFQPLDIPFGSLDTKTDERMLPPGALLVAENCSAQIVGGYTKRYGYTQLTNIGNVLKLSNRGNQLLMVGPGGNFFAHDGVSTWNSVGPVFTLGLPDAATTQTNIELDQSNDVTKGTRCTCNGVIVHAFARGGFLWVRLIDQASGGIIFEQSGDSGMFTSIHAAAAGTNVAIFYTIPATNTLSCIKVDCAARIVAAPVAVSVIVNGSLGVMDLCPLSATDVLVAWYTLTPNVRAIRFNVSSMTISSGPSILSADVLTGGLAIVGTTGEFGAILYHSTASGGMRAVLFNPSTLAVTVAAFTVEAVTVPAGVNCGLVRIDSSHVLAVWDRAASGITKQYVKWRQIDSGGGLSSSMGPLYNVALASKPFTGDVSAYGGTYLAINVWAPYDPQFTYFTVRIAVTAINIGFPTAMHAYRTAYNVAPPLGQLTDVDALSSSSFAFSAPIGYKFLSTSSVRAGWSSFGIDYRAASLFQSIEALGNTMFAAGLVGRMDGQNAAEVNFPLYPQITQAVVGSVASGGMDNGTYSYIVIWETSDVNGNTDRSTPSVAVAATTTAGAGLGKVTLTIDNLGITRQGVFGSGTIGSVFRTNAGGQTYRFIGSIINGSGGTASQLYVDSANDSTIASNRLLYSNDSDAGAIIEREPPLAAYQLVVHKNRIWGISSADRKLLFYSGELESGEAPWFSSLQQVRVEVGGDITAIASMDDKLVIFKSDRVFKMYGNGLNGLGTANDLSDPTLITGDAGCTDFRSVVSANGGIYFLSDKGLYGLSRGEELSYVGESADKYWIGYSTISAANMMPDRQEVRFEVSGWQGTVVDALSGAAINAQKLVQNYVTGQWTTHRNYQDSVVIDARVVGGVYYWATASGGIYKENSGFFAVGTFMDPGSTYVRSLIQTAWIKPAGFQGFCRTRRIGLLGNRKDPHQITLNVENDYVAGTINTTETWTSAQIATFGQELVSAHLVRQKGVSYRITAYDGSNGGPVTGEGPWFYGIQLYTKALRGTFEKMTLQAARG